MHMTTNDDDNTSFHDSFVGVSREDLQAMPDSELALCQSNLKPGEPKYILVDREWQRRMITHQLQEQYNLDAKLSKAAETHAEKLQKNTRWWSIAVAAIGVIGTLAGTVIETPSKASTETNSAYESTSKAPPASLPCVPQRVE